MMLIRAAIVLLSALASVPAQALGDPCAKLAGLRARPPVWEVRDADTKIILLPSINALPMNTDWRSKSVEAAIRSADGLLLDSPASLEEMNAGYSKHAFSSGLPPLKDRVRAELKSVIAEMAAHSYLQMQRLAQMKTWALAITLTSSAGNVCKPGPTWILQDEFHRGHRAVDALQSSDEVFGDFNNLSEGAQRKMLEDVLLKAGQDQLSELIKPWASGNIEQAAKAAQRQIGDSPELLAMLDLERTRLGTALEREMANPGTKLAVLGALYFTGPYSVIEHLKSRGHKARRIQ
jgi:uncharacterized protein YbaP (TraB family)